MNRGVVVVASCLLLAACGGSDSDSDSATTTSPPTTSPTTTVSATPTTTTESPVETTEAASTTVINADAQLAAAEQAYLDAFDAYIAAARDPANPDLRADIEQLYTGPSLEFTTSQLDLFVDQNWVARPGDEQSQTIVLVSARLVPGRDDVAELVSCEVNAERFVEVGAAPDGADALVTDEVTVDRLVVRVRLVDGIWMANSGEVVAELETPDECEL